MFFLIDFHTNLGLVSLRFSFTLGWDKLCNAEKTFFCCDGGTIGRNLPVLVLYLISWPPSISMF